MQGLHLDRGALRWRTDLPVPDPGPGEVCVQVLRAGICATDLALQRGYMGFAGVPGHEFVGRALGGRHAGRRVVGEINAGCGTCEDCVAGDPRHCATRSVLGIAGRGGAFAERLVLPEANLLPVPDSVGTDAATFTEPLAAAMQIQAQLALPRGTPTLVVGDGKLGILCAHALDAAGLQVTLCGRHPERQALVPAARFVEGWVEDAGPPRARFPLVVEASGNAAALPGALAHVAPRGTLLLKTTTESSVVLDAARIVVDEIRVQGSRCGRFAPALAALAAGAFDVTGLIAARYPLARGEAAFAHAASRGTLKVLLDVASE
ncbi:MAG: alcohol dehydrogenase catalytic domain-containing protein [Planctomycetota bacterium]